VAILKPHKFLSVLFPSMALLPEFGRLNKREQHFNRSDSVHLLTNDGFHLSNGSPTERKIRVDARRQFPDHSRPEHQLMARDLCLRRDFF
jgi:hypothetical protein